MSEITSLGSHQSASRNQPVTFTADSVEYDRENSLVIAQGHVEAWQDDHVLRADRVTFDRNTGVAAAKGNVVLLEPDGQVLFADYAELTQDMKNGVLRDMRAILAENGRMAANGARRTEGEINEMSKVVYSTCNLCAKDPTRPPLWQIRALSAVQDLEHKKIEFEDAVMEMYGVPIAYMPYFWTVDPSVKRASGLLIPSMGGVIAYRRLLRAAVLLGDRRSVGRDVHADDHDGSRPAAQRAIPPPVQQRLPLAGRLAWLSR